MANGYTLRWRGRQVLRRERDAAADGVSQAAAHLLSRSNMRVPIEDEGLLRSGRVSVDPASLRVVLTWTAHARGATDTGAYEATADVTWVQVFTTGGHLLF